MEEIKNNKKTTQKCVHTEHCCKYCGCKYGEDDICPVTNKLKQQEYECGKNGICNGY